MGRCGWWRSERYLDIVCSNTRTAAQGVHLVMPLNLALVRQIARIVKLPRAREVSNVTEKRIMSGGEAPMLNAAFIGNNTTVKHIGRTRLKIRYRITGNSSRRAQAHTLVKYHSFFCENELRL